MSYLKLNKNILDNKPEMLDREVLLTNALGCCYNTTLAQCNTRKYHGALVVPQRQIDTDSHVMLSAVAETIVYQDEQYGLSSMLFGGGVELPERRAEIIAADLSPTLQYTYACGEMRLRKTILLMQDSMQLICCYHLMETPLPIVLRLQPFMAFRGVHCLGRKDHTNMPKTKTIACS